MTANAGEKKGLILFTLNYFIPCPFLLLTSVIFIFVYYRKLLIFISTISYSMRLFYILMIINGKYVKEERKEKLIKVEKNGKLSDDERKLSRYYSSFLGSY